MWASFLSLTLLFVFYISYQFLVCICLLSNVRSKEPSNYLQATHSHIITFGGSGGIKSWKENWRTPQDQWLWKCRNYGAGNGAYGEAPEVWREIELQIMQEQMEMLIKLVADQLSIKLPEKGAEMVEQDMEFTKLTKMDMCRGQERNIPSTAGEDHL